MKKRISVLCFLMCLVCMIVTCLTACGSSDGTYYLYENGSYDESDYITIRKDTWTDSSGASGPVERNGNKITLYISLFGDEEIVWEGTCQKGVLTLSDGYQTAYFCKKGKTPAGTDHNGDNTTGGDSGTGGSSTGGVTGDGPNVTLTFRTQGGKELPPITAPAGSSVSIPTPEYDGYIFRGWYLSRDYLSKEKFESATMPDSDTTLWAKWEKKPVEYKNDYLTATGFTKWNDSHYAFSGEKMTIRYTSDEHRPGSTYNLNTGIEAKSGYNIVWYQDEDCTITIGTQRDELSYGDNIYYATIVDAKNGQFVEKYMINVYLRRDYTYTYFPYAPGYALGGEFGEYYSERVIEDDTTHAPQAPDTGYTFKRWVTQNRDGDYTEYNYNTPATGNRYFYAEWESVSLTLNTGDGATLLAGSSTTVSFSPFGTSSVNVIPTMETQVFLGYYAGDTRYFDENGKLLTPLPVSAIGSLSAAYGDSQDPVLRFTANNGGYTVFMNKMPTYETKVVIPATYQSKPVTAIGARAFAGYKRLTNVLIPESVTKIGYDAFSGCSSLQTLTLPMTSLLTETQVSYTVQNDGTYPFSYVDGILASTNKRNGSTSNFKIIAKSDITVTFSYMASSESDYDKLTILKNNTTLITTSGTSNSYTSYSVTLAAGDTLTFSYSKDGSQSSGSDCAYFKNIQINSTPLNMNDADATRTTHTLGSLFGTAAYDGGTPIKQGNTPYYIPLTLREITVVGTADISASAFENCTMIRRVTFNTTNIGDRAFSGCTGLNSITIPNSVTSIGSSAFSGCTGLTSITIPDKVTSIGANAFDGCTALKAINYTGGIAGWCGITGLANLMASGRALTINGKEVTGALVIPAGVTSIADSAFRYCTGLTSVTIGNGVTSIGSSAFSGCSSLTSITIPFVGGSASATSASESTLFGYIFGTSSYIGGTATKQYYKSGSSATYYIPSSLKEVTVTGGNLLYGAFYGCTGLTSVTIGNGVTSIGSSAFSGCTGLTSITIPDSVTSIGEYAFRGCTGLTSVTIGNGVKSIGSSAYYGCTALANIRYTGTLADWCGITGLENLMASGRTLTIDGKEVTGALVIPAGVTSIADSAFRYCTGLTSVTIGNGVTSIGDSAFSGCTRLTSITIPNSVTSIGSSAFSGCTGLTSITLPFVGGSASATSASESTLFGYIFGSDSYTGCGTATKQYYKSGSSATYYIPSSLKEVTVTGGNLLYGAFYGCTGLTSITIPNSVKSIGRGAFYGCTGLANICYTGTLADWCGITGLENLMASGRTLTIDGKEVTGALVIPAGVTSIADSAFRYCTGLTSVTIGNGVKSIGSYAFYGCTGLTSVTIPNSVTSIGRGAFDGCTGLTSITIPNSVTSIGDSAFYCCTGLTSVTIGNSVTSIGDAAFCGCTRLTSITIPNSVTSIGRGAFSGCTGLTSITIPNNVTSIGSSAFSGCSSLTSITIPFVGGSASATSASESTLFGYIFGSDSYTGCGTATKQYYKSGSSATYYIPSSLKEVTVTGGNLLYGAFYGCTGLTSITIPNSVKSIGDSAFYCCTGLTSITIPNSVKSIGDSAFYCCTGLTSVTIGNGVKSIGRGAFYGCTGLTSITIPNNVTSIGSSAFSGCSSLTSITIPFVGGSASVTWASSSTLFGYIFGSDSYTGYGTATKQYYDSNNYATYYIPSSLKEVTVTGGNLLYGAFYGCTGLTSVTIGNGVTSIGEYAFRGCTALANIRYTGTLAGWCGITGLGNLMASGRALTIDGKEVTGALVIPAGVTSIADSAFRYCTGLTSVTIGNGVTSIGSSAFSGCSSLTSITIPFVGGSADATSDSKSTLFGYIFGTSSYTGGTETKQPYGSNNYATYYIPSGLTKVTVTGGNLLYGAFYNCTGLTSVTIGSGVTSIGNYAFRGCTGLTSVTIGNGVTSIGEYAFRGCTGLTSVTIGNGVKSIGSSAYYGCTALANIRYMGTLADWCGITGLENLMASGRTLTIDGKEVTGALVIPAGVTSIADSAFRYCTGLTSVTIGNGVTSIGDSAFSGCTRLTSITIPNSVTSIGSSAFSGCTGLTSVTIPNSVTSIGDFVFSGCTGLTSVTIGNGVTSIGYKAFDGCKGLTSITIPSSVTSIGSSAFSGCTGLTSVILGSGVKSIGGYAFSGCTAKIIWDGTPTIQTIGGYAFSGYEGTELTIPVSVTSIADSAFRYCTGLTSVTIPNSVTSIGSSAFSGCKGLTSITLPFIGGSASATSASESTLFGYIFGTSSYTGGTATKQYYDSNNYATYYIPSSLKEVTVTGKQVLYGAFYNCTGLTSVTIGNGVTSIGSSAFSGCSSLTSITIPFVGGSASATSASASTLFGYIFGTSSYTGGMATRQFYGSYATYYIPSGLKKVTVTGGNLLYGAFYNCTGLTSVTIGNSVTSIGSYAFYGCTGLTSVTIENGVTSIGSYAFYGCTGLTSVTIGNGVTSIGEYAFRGCTGLTSITIPNSVTSITDSAFRYCTGLTSVTIGNGVTSIGSSAFSGCTGLTSIAIPNSVKNIGSSAFSGCTGLTSITIPFVGGSADATSASASTLFGYIFGTSYYSGGTATEPYYSSTYYIPSALTKVTVTGGNLLGGAFRGCTGLTSVTIGSGVKSIGDSAFYCCTGLTSVTIENGVTSTGDWAFYGCTGLTSVTIENGVTSIGDAAFRGCTRLTFIIIPNSVTSIGDDAFYGCTGLTSITIPNSVTSIGSSAFYNTGYYNCDSNWKNGVLYIGKHLIEAKDTLSGSYQINSGTLTIADNAFSGCTGLTAIAIPNSVTSIGRGAFRGCTGLTSITIPNSVTSIGGSAFSDCTGLTSITIPNSVTSIAAFSGCTGLTSITIPNSVTSIGSSAFSGCTGLTSVTIPNSVTSIGYSAFHGCAGLTSITIPDSVTSIGYAAFRNCTGLTSITIPNSVTSIENHAFYNCTGLTSITIPNSVTSIGYSAFYGCTKLTSVTFKTTSGWYRTGSGTATSGTSIDVTNAATNAKNLTSTYCDYCWKRNG